VNNTNMLGPILFLKGRFVSLHVVCIADPNFIRDFLARSEPDLE
jgi:hypothetical protein